MTRLSVSYCSLRFAHCPCAATGRPRGSSDERALKFMFLVLRSGMQWREVDCEVNYTTVLRRMLLWQRKGVFLEAYNKALRTYKRLHPNAFYCVDSCFVKNAFSSTCVGRNHTDRGRKALKLSVVVDQDGIPFGACCHPGNRPDVTLLDDTLSASFQHLDSLQLFADRGYDSRNNRRICSRHNLLDRIFRKRTRTTRRANAKRVVVEHTFAWMKRFRRMHQMYEHTPEQFLAFFILCFGHILVSRFTYNSVDFVRRIRSLRRDDNKTLAIAYGSWGAIAGRPGAACNRSLPPCLGCGLRRKLAAHFLIIPTPEAYTSKTCSLCGATCGPCETVDHQHREARTNAATTDVERQRAARFSVRGLRHCHNASCAAHLNRDRNAAVNIQRRCQTLLRNATLNVSVDDTDAEFEALRLWMCQGA